MKRVSGSASIRVLHQVGSKIDKVIGRSEYPACDEAIRTQSSSVRSGFVAAPLSRKAKDGHNSSFDRPLLVSEKLAYTRRCDSTRATKRARQSPVLLLRTAGGQRHQPRHQGMSLDDLLTKLS